MGFFDKLMGPRPVNVELTKEQADIVKQFDDDDWSRLTELSQPQRGDNGQFQARTPRGAEGFPSRLPSTPNPDTNRNGMASQNSQLSPVQQLFNQTPSQNGVPQTQQYNNGFQNPHTPANVYVNSTPIAEEIARMGHDGVKNLTDQQAQELLGAFISEAQQTGSLG